MRILVRPGGQNPDIAPFDAAERKGIGHPDSLADLLADTFSHRYATWCLDRFGLIPNHWVDKVTLVGASAHVTFGRFDIHKPIGCYLFGKITDQVGTDAIPVVDLFHDTVSHVIPAVLGDPRALDHVRLVVENTRGVAPDHDRQFYLPHDATALQDVLTQESVANDTVICVGTSRRSLVADLAIRIERRLTGPDFRSAFPQVGTDVKVMIVRADAELDITVAVPFHPELVDSFTDYRAGLGEMQAAISAELKDLLDADARAGEITGIALHLNTKDAPGRGYLAPFGTSLGKGDCGAVGRGNRYSGVIEPLRPASAEAPAGKNPLHHVGKIYTAVAQDTAARIEADSGAYAEVTIAARNGGSLTDPAYVMVGLDRTPDQRDRARIEQIVRDTIADSGGFADQFLAVDPVERFRGGQQW